MINNLTYSHQLISLIKRLFFILILFSITRLFFFIINFSEFNNQGVLPILQAFFFGIRFDMSVVYYCNFLFIFLSILPFKIIRNKYFQTGLKVLFIAVNIILLGLNLIDTGYFAVIKRRSGWDMLTTLFSSPETPNLLVSYLTDYWHLTLLLIITVYLLVKYYPKLRHHNLCILNNRIAHISLLTSVSLLILIGGFAVARGLERKPLRLISANDYVKPKYTPLLLNTPFTILNTMGHKILNNAVYITYQEAEELFTPIQKFDQDKAFNKKNVVIIILESFGSEYIFGHKTKEHNFTPFLDSLMANGLLCSNSVANSSNSRDALPAILASMPSLRGIDYMGSRYSTNTVRGLPTILKEEGYSTSFFHGGHNGTMSFNKFSKVVEIEKYYGYNEYVNKMGRQADDGSWGIYDEEFFQFMAHEIDNFKIPFFTSVFSLSSHDPYPIPERYNGKFPEGPLTILKSIAYTDFALQKFFQIIKNKDWYNNTLFVIVADHTSTTELPEYKTHKTKFSIPILYYSPTDKSLQGEYKEICQQTDIMPTVLDYLGYNKKFNAFGESIFRNNYRFAVNYLSNFNVYDSAYTLIFDGKNLNAFYNYKTDPMHLNNLDSLKQPDLLLYLKSYIQNYEYRMVYNKIADTIPISEFQSLEK